MASKEVKQLGRFENQDSNEFWIAEIQNNIVTIHFGKIGTEGHTASREFKSNDDAEQFLSQRLKSKIESGFVLVDES